MKEAHDRQAREGQLVSSPQERDQEGDRQRAAADAHKAGNGADEQACARHAGKAGQVAGRIGLFVQEHVGGHIVQEADEEHLKVTGRDLCGHEGTAVGADEDAQRDVLEDVPVHTTLAMLFKLG